MAKRGDNLFLLVALGLGAAAWVLFRKAPVSAGPATDSSGVAQGGVPGSPHQPGVTDGSSIFNYNAVLRTGL